MEHFGIIHLKQGALRITLLFVQKEKTRRFSKIKNKTFFVIFAILFFVPDTLSFTGKQWKFRGEKIPEENPFQSFCRIRKLTKKDFQKAKFSDLSDPENIPGVAEATERILKAIENKEKILIFGDFDLDGASGVATLYLGMKTLGAKVFPKLPQRNEGHGLRNDIFDKAKEFGISLVITVDCGSGNGPEIEYGNFLGIETIITDHHTLPEVHPNASVIVHPHLGNPHSEEWDLTGSGVAFFLAKNILKKKYLGKNLDPLLKQLAELAVLGTVADVGALRKQNRVLTSLGIEEIKKSSHPGISELLKIAKIDEKNVTAETIAFFIAPRLNAAGRLSDPNISLNLLLGNKKMATELQTLNEERQQITADLTDFASSLLGEKNTPAVIVSSEDFFPGISGLIAARLSENTNKPAIVLAPSECGKKLMASCRGPEDFHLANALKELDELFEKHGGHECAAGFVMPKEHFSEFEKRFHELTRRERGNTPPPPRLDADFIVELSDIFHPHFWHIFSAAPFGEANPAPLFVVQGVHMEDLRAVGSDKTHLAGAIKLGNTKLKFIAFRFAEHLGKFADGFPVDILFSPEKSMWNGKMETKAKVVDIRKSEK